MSAEQDKDYSGLIALALTYLGALLFAAILAPWVYHEIQSWHATNPNLLTEEIADNGFDDYFDRLRWLWVLACLPWLIRRLHLKGWAANGFSWDTLDWMACFKYCVVGIALLITVAVVRLPTAEFSISKELSEKWSGILIEAALGALLIAFLEEYVFRSLIWKAFSMWRPIIGGVVIASVFFAYTHYKMPDDLWDAYNGSIQFSAGLYVAWGTLIGFFYDASLLDFLNLTLLGVWLSLLRIRSNNLARSLGLHAGIVFALLTFVEMVDVQTTPLRWLFGGPGLRDGLLTFLIFSGGVFIEVKSFRHSASSVQ